MQKRMPTTFCDQYGLLRTYEQELQSELATTCLLAQMRHLIAGLPGKKGEDLPTTSYQRLLTNLVR